MFPCSLAHILQFHPKMKTKKNTWQLYNAPTSDRTITFLQAVDTPLFNWGWAHSIGVLKILTDFEILLHQAHPLSDLMPGTRILCLHLQRVCIANLLLIRCCYSLRLFVNLLRQVICCFQSHYIVPVQTLQVCLRLGLV